MATTTPNYGWAVPTSTDLVKDGATAIETLGDAIDASMNTALGTKKAGMVLLNTTSFSAVSSQSFNDVFSSTYDNYKIVLNVDTSAASTELLFRLRVSGSDNTSANYIWGYSQAQVGVLGGSSSGNSTAATSWTFSTGSGTYTSIGEATIFKPFATDNTGFVNLSDYYDSISNHGIRMSGGLTTVTTSYTGFTIYPGSGTITGTVRIYGYNQ